MSLFEHRHIVLMGVCGCGKSTVGAELSRASGIDFLDGDDLHPAENVAKMRAGIPLDDADRAPWLAECGRRLATAEEGLILGCSALTGLYRDMIRAHAAPAQPVFVYLHGTRAALRQRLGARRGHFMPSALLDSQLATLEVPAPAEAALTVSIENTSQALAAQVLTRLAGRGGSVARAA